MSNEPRTAAGRDFLNRVSPAYRDPWLSDVLAIEAEAREAAPDSEALRAVAEEVALALEAMALGFEKKDADERPDSYGPGIHPLTQLLTNDLRSKARRLREAAATPASAPPSPALDAHRLGGLIERAIRQSKRESGGLLTDGWTLVEMALSYPPETPTEPSQQIPARLTEAAEPTVTGSLNPDGSHVGDWVSRED